MTPSQPRKGHIRAKQTFCLPTTTSKTYDSVLNTRSSVKDWRHLATTKLNGPGRQTFGRCGSPVSRHSMQSYVLTYYRLRQREPLIAPGSYQVGRHFCIRGIPPRGWGWRGRVVGGGGGGEMNTPAMRRTRIWTLQRVKEHKSNNDNGHQPSIMHTKDNPVRNNTRAALNEPRKGAKPIAKCRWGP